MSETGIYALVALISFVAGFALGESSKDLRNEFVARRSKWIKCKAVVTKISKTPNGSSRPGYSYYPIFRYSYADKEYNGIASISVPRDGYKAGQEIEIVLNPVDPLEADLTYSFNIGKRAFDTFGVLTKALPVLRIACFAVSALSVAIMAFKIMKSGHF